MRGVRLWITAAVLWAVCCGALADYRPPLPDGWAEPFPPLKAIDLVDREQAEAQVETYCRALFAAEALSQSVSAEKAQIDWLPVGDYGGTVYLVRLQDEEGRAVGVNLRPDGSVMMLHCAWDAPYDSLLREYTEQQTRTRYSDVWVDRLCGLGAAFIQAVDPGQTALLEGLRVSCAREYRDGQVILELWGQAKEGPNPSLTVQAAPQFRILHYSSTASFQGVPQGHEMTLQGTEDDLHLIVFDAFSVQRVEAAPDREGRLYTFQNPDTGEKLTVDGRAKTAKEQADVLKTLRADPEGYAILEDVRIGYFYYLVYHPIQDNADWTFWMCTSQGRGYSFQWQLPKGQDDLPLQQASMLSSLYLTSPAGDGPLPVPAFPAADFPAVEPIDENNKPQAEKLMEAYCRALLRAMGITPAEDAAIIDWKPQQYNMPGWHYGTVYTVTLWARPAGAEGEPDEVFIALRPDGSVRDFHYSLPQEAALPGYSTLEYSPEEADAVLPPNWQEELAAYFLQYTEAVWPGSADRMKAVRLSWTCISGSGRWQVSLYGEYFLPDGTKHFYSPSMTVEVWPAFRVLEYGLGVG